MAEVPTLSGERVVLRPLVEDDAVLCHRWLNDPVVARTLAVHGRTITEAESRVFIRAAAARRDQLFAIVVRADGRYVGNAGLHAVDPVDRRAELGLFIGLPERWGQGIGRESVGLLCRHAFDTLGLHRLGLSCYASNARGLALYARLGFRIEGRRRDAVCIDGEWIDEIVLGLLRGELM